MYKMHILKDVGNYNCFRCQAHGNWYNFKNEVIMRFYGKKLNELVGDTSGISQGN
jgi:hypothetical protein